ncbi:MAG: glycosyltransferase family 2 protein [Dehalococcoidia bacterium]
MGDELSALDPGISVVIPVYNGARTIGQLVERLKGVLAGLPCDFEILLINDGSEDDSWDMVNGLASSDTRIRGINLMRNYGQHNALLCGVRNATKDVIVTLDDDLQNPPEEIPKLLALIEAGNDLVYGTSDRSAQGLPRRLATLATKWALRSAMGVSAAKYVSSFRAFRTRLRDAFADYNSSFVCLDVLLAWGTARIAAAPVAHEARAVGLSNYTVFSLSRHALDMLTGFSVVPLQIVSLVGLLLSIFGFIVLIYVVISFFVFGGGVPGFSFLASLIAIFSGAQFLALGIIGEYLGRVHFRAMDKPPYAVSEMVETVR